MYIVKKSQYKPLEGKHIGLQSISSKKIKDPKQQTTRELLIKFIKEQNKFNQEQRMHNASVESRLNELRKDVKTIFTILDRNHIH